MRGFTIWLGIAYGSNGEPMACVPQLAHRAPSAGTRAIGWQIATDPTPTPVQPNLRRWLQLVLVFQQADPEQLVLAVEGS